MSQPSPDARAVVAAVDRLTTQVSAEIRRLADALSTPADAPATTADDAPPRRIGHWFPMNEQQAEEMNERSSLIQQWAAGAVETARADDEKQQRTERRRSLRVLLNRVNRGLALTASEAQLLTQHVTTLITDAAAERKHAEQTRADLKALGQTALDYQQRAWDAEAKLKQAQAAIERVRTLRDPIADAIERADYSGNMRRGDLADSVMPVIRAALDGTEQPTITEQPDENARLIAEYQAAVLRVLAVSDNPLNGQPASGPEQEAYVRGWRFAIHEVRRAIESSEQPTTEA